VVSSECDNQANRHLLEFPNKAVLPSGISTKAHYLYHRAIRLLVSVYHTSLPLGWVLGYLGIGWTKVLQSALSFPATYEVRRTLSPLSIKGGYGTKDKVSDKTANIEKKLDRIIELLEKDKGE
jgi:hypothetical protein